MHPVDGLLAGLFHCVLTYHEFVDSEGKTLQASPGWWLCKVLHNPATKRAVADGEPNENRQDSQRTDRTLARIPDGSGWFGGVYDCGVRVRRAVGTPSLAVATGHPGSISTPCP